MAWLIVIICIILVVVFWRVFLPLALIAAVGLVILLLYFQNESNQRERERQIENKRIAQEQQVEAQKARQAIEAAKQKIADAQATAANVVRKWKVLSETDPASGEKVPRYAGVLSDDGLCRLQVEQRMDGTKLTSIYCKDFKVLNHDSIEAKFDNRPTSDRMKVEEFSNGDGIYIPTNQWPYYVGDNLHGEGYTEFIRRLTDAKKVALLLSVDGIGPYWTKFQLTGSISALTKIGAFSLPSNARLSDSGTDWECNSGYSRSGNGCVEVKPPANAKLDLWGHNWECNSGYSRSGNGCVEVKPPANAKLDLWGHNWECNSGYSRSGNGCVEVKPPANAKLDLWGHNWECNSGYSRSGNGCVPVGM